MPCEIAFFSEFAPGASRLVRSTIPSPKTTPNPQTPLRVKLTNFIFPSLLIRVPISPTRNYAFDAVNASRFCQSK